MVNKMVKYKMETCSHNTDRIDMERVITKKDVRVSNIRAECSLGWKLIHMLTEAKCNQLISATPSLKTTLQSLNCQLRENRSSTLSKKSHDKVDLNQKRLNAASPVTSYISKLKQSLK